MHENLCNIEKVSCPSQCNLFLVVGEAQMVLSKTTSAVSHMPCSKIEWKQKATHVHESEDHCPLVKRESSPCSKSRDTKSSPQRLGALDAQMWNETHNYRARGSRWQLERCTARRRATKEHSDAMYERDGLSQPSSATMKVIRGRRDHREDSNVKLLDVHLPANLLHPAQSTPQVLQLARQHNLPAKKSDVLSSCRSESIMN